MQGFRETEQRYRGPSQRQSTYVKRQNLAPSSVETPLLRDMNTALGAMPPTSVFRIGILLIVSVLMIGAVATLGTILVKQTNETNLTDKAVLTAHQVIASIRKKIANIEPPPACNTSGTTDIDTTFPDDLFAIYRVDDTNTKIRFDLGGIEANTSSDVVLTIRDQDLNVHPNGGTIAYLSDIPPIIATTFSDTEFGVRNSADNSKLIRFDLGSFSQSRIIDARNASGTVAYLHNIETFGGFLHDVFVIFHELDSSKELMFDTTDAPPGNIVNLGIQDAPGTILLLSDITSLEPPFADDVFVLQRAADSTSRLGFVLDNLIPSSTVTLGVRDASGTVAYLDDAPEFFEVWVNTTRRFPHLDYEGVQFLHELGNVVYLDISVCGGGGGGGARIDPYEGAGGGSGSGHERFPITQPVDKFNSFDVTIGQGGVGDQLDHGSDGGRSRVVGNTFLSGHVLDISGWGGGGGARGTGLDTRGGCGGGNGGGATTVSDGSASTINTPGPAGILGGFVGGLGGLVDGTGIHGIPGALTGGWRAGGGGGANGGNGAPWLHGAPSRTCPTSGGGCGADGMFGLGGGDNSLDGGPCAGGGGGPDSGGGKGGDGMVLIRYFLEN